MTIETNLNDLFVSALDENLNKNDTILLLVNKGNLDVTSAVRMYTKLAREHGVLLSAKDRTIKINEFLSETDEDLADADVRSALAEQLADEYEISSATAHQHIRDFCENNGVELPTIQRTPFTDIVAFVQDDREAGVERAETIKKLSEQFNLGINSAASAYSRVMKELGLSSARGGAKCEVAVLVAAIRANRSKPKAEAVKAVIAATGYSEATTKAFFNQIPFAEEWSRQDLA